MIVNFGGNVRFEPDAISRPIDREALLQDLAEAKAPIRAIGSLHSWSPLAETRGTVIDMSRFDFVEVIGGEPPIARIGGGARLEHVLDRLSEQGYTLPTLGAVREQTLAGAISTATHGSGRKSLSSFVDAVELATLDEQGHAAIVRVDSGADLEAARCSLGALGVIVSVEIGIVRKYQVVESFVERSRLRDILGETEQWPLQQFILIPWAWRWFSFRRKVASNRSGLLKRTAWKAWNVISIDLGAHILSKVAVAVQKAGSDVAVKRLLRDVVPRSLITGAEVTDDSERILTLNHQWFRHLETEIFVPEPHVEEAMEIVEHLTRAFGGEKNGFPGAVGEALDNAGLREEVEGLRGSFTHHYPIFLRRVLADDTMISMSAAADGADAWYSISLFSYMEPRDSYYEYAGIVARVLSARFVARPHWGKYIPIRPELVSDTYPRMGEFRATADRFDPSGAFRNDMIQRYLDLAEPSG